MEIKKSYIYRYTDNGKSPLCIYLCDTQAKNRILIMPLTSEGSEHTYKLSVTKQYADLANYKEINKDSLVSALFLNSKPVKISISDLTVIQVYIIKSILDSVCNSAFANNTSFQMFEIIYQFLVWKRQKFLLNVLPYKKKTDVYENGIYWASLGVNVGSELNKNRPVLIWKKRCSGPDEQDYSYIVIPITSKNKGKKYYMNVPVEINGSTSYLRIEDMHRVNIKRISRPILDQNKKIVFINSEKRKEIISAIERLYIFENQYK